MAALEERLSELEGERAELAKFQQVDKQRRSLEYTIYDTEITEARQKLEQARPVPSPPSCLTVFLPGWSTVVADSWIWVCINAASCSILAQCFAPIRRAAAAFLPSMYQLAYFTNRTIDMVSKIVCL